MMDDKLILSGDETVPEFPLSDSQVNHLRRLLAWLRVEYTLDEDMQRGYLMGASESVRLGIASQEDAGRIVQEKADQIDHVPAYVRQGIKMLTKALHEHERQSGIVESGDGDGR